MTRRIYYMLVLLLCNVKCIIGAKILGVFPCPGYSQFILGGTLMRQLVARGHEVTVISPYPLREPINNYEDVSTEGLLKVLQDENLFLLERKSSISNIINVYNLGYAITEYTLENENVKNLLKSNTTFDLIILEQFFDEALMGLSFHFKAPYILFNSMGSREWTNHLVGNPNLPSIVPNTFAGYSHRMDFWQRLRNMALQMFDYFYKKTIAFPFHDELLKKHFPGSPNLYSTMYNSSLMILNSHVSINQPVPQVPCMVEIGGFHVSPKPLSEDLKTYLDSAQNGVIFFSMGSNLRSSDLDNDKQDVILKAFSKLKQKVLWKWEKNELPNQPNNVKVGKWLPQQDILAHPNVRLFITHGGLLSTTEAVHNGVPIIGIPIYGDQKMNIVTAVENGYGIILPFQEITEKRLLVAITEILSNSSYKSNAEKQSRILRDRPIKPIELAMYWIEYVIQHNGAPHLKSAGINMTLFQYYSGDTLLFMTIGLIIIITCVIVILNTLVCRKKSVKRKEKKQ